MKLKMIALLLPPPHGFHICMSKLSNVHTFVWFRDFSGDIQISDGNQTNSGFIRAATKKSKRI